MTLPIEALIPEIRQQLQNRAALVLQAPPGAGKTTRVPLALLHETWLAGQQILVLEPRRLAARAAAQRMAAALGEAVGATVGYRTRFDSQVSAQTRIEVLTEGILTRRLQQDPALEGVGLVIFDEYHERSLHADTALAFCLESRQTLREDLKLLVMSATLDGAAVSRLLGDAPLLSSAGRSYPVQVHYLPMDAPQRIADNLAQVLRQILPDSHGDILAFLPGSGEIRQTLALLRADCPAWLDLCPLFGDLSQAAQDAALQPALPGRRKLVLATPIAETSLTIVGITTVVDSGWRKTPCFDPRTGLSRLTLQRISKASAEQRAGRAGRLQAGVCYRLWSASQQAALIAQTPAEICTADLAPLALELAQWGVRDAATLAWLDPPPPGALAQARELLQNLEALDADYRLTPTGSQLLRWGLHPRLARMLVAAQNLGWGALACDLAALLSERDLMRGEAAQGHSDLHRRLEALTAYRSGGAPAARSMGADAAACGLVEQAARQWRRGLREAPQPTHADSAGVLLAFAYPDRIAVRRAATGNRYRLANGRGASLIDAPLSPPHYLVAAALDAGQQEARIFLAAPLSAAAIDRYLGTLLQERAQIAWDSREGAVVAVQEQRLGQLVLRSTPLTTLTAAQQQTALTQGIRSHGLGVLPWCDSSRSWQARVLSLRSWFPEQAWPDVSDTWLLAHLEDWLTPALSGMSRLSHLSKLHLPTLLQALLTWPLPQQLEQLAPASLLVPSGSRIGLSYQPGAEPVLAVRLQELFGLEDTPRIANGQIAVTLHLLSPARRPIQVTRDLRSFWNNTYAEVKKELKGRYPKHDWPDNPRLAAPSRGAKRRRVD